ncbi:MAG: phosphoribosylformylglycinamidine cyclo-ligase [Gammaproteobacteria bacterium]|nr:phosphoribosylformylglycinamidine cyclo-ligase [Gammaproteobacteria bacterium]
MGLTYKQAGVNVSAGNQLVERIKPHVTATHHSHMLSNIGGFAGLADIPKSYKNPILVFGTDGVGSKLELAMQYDQHEHVGQDLVAMCVNDILATGGEPFVFLDYFATGKLDVDLAERVIKGIAHACQLAGCALGGGETAEMPGFYSDSQYDLAGFAIGLAERDELLTHKTLTETDVLIGLPSVGPHSNGYSLIRRILANGNEPPTEVLEQILAPTEIYVKPVLACRELIKRACHITGGGFEDNLPRVFPPQLKASIELGSWKVPVCFEWIQKAGNVETEEMFRTFNQGIGMILICDSANANSLLDKLQSENVSAVQVGELQPMDHEFESGRLIVSHEGMYFS